MANKALDVSNEIKNDVFVHIQRSGNSDAWINVKQISIFMSSPETDRWPAELVIHMKNGAELKLMGEFAEKALFALDQALYLYERPSREFEL